LISPTRPSNAFICLLDPAVRSLEKMPMFAVSVCRRLVS
jgi:hypothetical protein